MGRDDLSRFAVLNWAVYEIVGGFVMKKIVALGLVLVMLAGFAWQAAAEEGLSMDFEGIITPLLPGTPLILDQWSDRVKTEDSQLFAFTPTSTQYYEFLSTGYGPYCYIVCSDFSLLEQDQNSGGDGAFRTIVRLEAGKTYYLLTLIEEDYEWFTVEDFSVRVKAFGETPYQFRNDGPVIIRYHTERSYTPFYRLDGMYVRGEVQGHGIKVNGTPIESTEWGSPIKFRGEKPGTLATWVYTDADDKEIGTIEIVCRLSPLQAICYYGLLGFLWMPHTGYIDWDFYRGYFIEKTPMEQLRRFGMFLWYMPFRHRP
jgi:hypothetical protein